MYTTALDSICAAAPRPNSFTKPKSAILGSNSSSNYSMFSGLTSHCTIHSRHSFMEEGPFATPSAMLYLWPLSRRGDYQTRRCHFFSGKVRFTFNFQHSTAKPDNRCHQLLKSVKFSPFKKLIRFKNSKLI